MAKDKNDPALKEVDAPVITPVVKRSAAKKVYRARFGFYDAYLQREFRAGDIVDWPDARVRDYIAQGTTSPIIESSEVEPVEVK